MFRLIRILFLLTTILSSFSGSQAQDAQYSQFYAAPLYLNPAFAGSALATRVGGNYRNQWPGLDASYVTYSAYVDHYMPSIKSGVGLLVTNDQQGFGKFRNTDIGAQYAYQLELNDDWAFRVGLQGSYVMRNSGYFGMIFGNQYTRDGFDPSIPSEALDYVSNNYVDLSSGGVLYSDKFYVGYAAHHMNRPNQSVLAGGNSPLPMKSTITAGMKIHLDKKTKRGLKVSKNEREISFSPALLYKIQGKFSQLDIGMYYTYEPLVLGVWYRGLPIVKSLDGLYNNDAAIFLVGFRNNNLSMGYSYDLTISSLTPSTGGSHEISVSYIFPRAPHKKKLPRSARRLPCPKF
ncbi:MAG: type IX secretion system membrane protein PorP/SprF [Bacteroidota bacterium]